MEPSKRRSRALSMPGANLSLRVRLLALLGAAGLLPMVVIGVLGSQTAADNLTDGQRVELGDVAEEISETTDLILGERYGDTQAFARSESARSMDPGRIGTWMDTVMSASAPSYRLMAVADPGGRLVAARAVDQEGRAVKATAEGTGLDVTDQTWFQAATRGRIRDGETLVEDVAPDGLLDRLGGDGDARTVGFTAPIRDARGRVVGVWSSRFNFDVILDLTDEPQEHLRAHGLSTAKVILASADGVVLHAGGGSPAVGTKLGDKPVVQQALRPDAAGSAETGALDGGQGTVLVGYHRISGEGAFAGLGWVVLATESLGEATRPAKALVRRMLLIGLVIATGMVVLAYLIAAASCGGCASTRPSPPGSPAAT
jgi:hypothetical protein